MRLAVGLALILAGAPCCASPPTGSMWGFFTDSNALIAPRVNSWLGAGSIVSATTESADQDALAKLEARTPCLRLTATASRWW